MRCCNLGLRHAHHDADMPYLIGILKRCSIQDIVKPSIQRVFMQTFLLVKEIANLKYMQGDYIDYMLL